MANTIEAKVNNRILTKADRLFTGTLEGRITEVLQNSRRAGAKNVTIENFSGGVVRVTDDGKGIENFQLLLDLGGSGWDDIIENGEDPAGIGLFSLAPRTVRIVSRNKQVIITEKGWLSEPIAITTQKISKGTMLEFGDDKWDMKAVEPCAVFTEMQITVDGTKCRRESFCDDAEMMPDIGCKISFRKELKGIRNDCLERCSKDAWWKNHKHILINFHGQVVLMEWPEGLQSISKLKNVMIEVTQDTKLRMMLPARTRIVENHAYRTLCKAIEVEFYKHIKNQEEHALSFSLHQRAKELGIHLKEAKIEICLGVLHDDLIDNDYEEGFDEHTIKPGQYVCDANDNDLIHSLAKYGDHKITPICVDSDYKGYGWAKSIPTLTDVKLRIGKTLHKSELQWSTVSLVNELTVSARASDSKRTFKSKIPIAHTKAEYNDGPILMTPKARELCTDTIWYFLGGVNEDCGADSYDTQEFEVNKGIEEFWAETEGPYENLRRKLALELRSIPSKTLENLKRASITRDSVLTLEFEDGKVETIKEKETNNADS